MNWQLFLFVASLTLICNANDLNVHIFEVVDGRKKKTNQMNQSIEWQMSFTGPHEIAAGHSKTKEKTQTAAASQCIYFDATSYRSMEVQYLVHIWRRVSVLALPPFLCW